LSSPFQPTLTEARLRAGQGDVSGARDLLQAVLEGDPANQEARRLLERLEGQEDRPRGGGDAAQLAPPQATEAAELSTRFRQALGAPDGRARIRRLQRWLLRIRKRR
jgi:hypothetical protein